MIKLEQIPELEAGTDRDLPERDARDNQLVLGVDARPNNAKLF